VKVNGIVYTSGQIAIVPSSGNIEATDIQGQTKQVMENLKNVLAASGTSFAQVVKTTCFLSDIADFGAFNEVYGQYITEKPARSCVAVKDLPKGALVEVEVIAVTD
ncbi:MAG: Rid family detoxifying hydrolase, partial [Oscillospiraceae bacterium]|nr:Rid family detoxifying hydrolase [Oscillospiraceae bacterium]